MGSRLNLALGLAIASFAVVVLGLVAVLTTDGGPAPSATPTPGALTEPPITNVVTPTSPPPTVAGSPTFAATPTSSPTPAFTPEPTPTTAPPVAMTGPSSAIPWIGAVLLVLGTGLIRLLRRTA